MKSLFNIRTITEIAIFAAIGYVLDFLAGAYSKPLFPNGGSIGLALLPVFIISFRRGPVAGILTGLIMGLLDLADGFYAIAGTWWKAFLQVALDYWIAYPLAGFAGFLSYALKEDDTPKRRVTIILLGCLLGGMLKFLSHYLSGVLFWGDDQSAFAWGLYSLNKYTYSLIYNIAYMGPCIIVSGSLMALITIKFPKFLFPNEKEEISKEVKE